MKPITILIADDNEVIREALHALLELREDIEVVGEAANGLEAVERAEALKPRIVIMDVRMPKMGGVEATRRLLQTCPETKVVAFTADDHEVYAKEMIEVGASAVLLKPCSLDDLIATLNNVLGIQPG